MKKRSRPKNIRKGHVRESVDEGEDTSDIHRKLEESRKLQTLRSRPKGINATALAFGEVTVPLEQNSSSDAFKLSSGGLVELGDLHGEIEEDTDDISRKISNNFAVETKQRDEDVNMIKYIEKEMSKRLGSCERDKAQQDVVGSTYENKLKELYAIPDSLQADKKLNSEEMLSNQILSGIPEFDLGMNEKFRNIQATEVAVRELVRQQLRQEETDTSLIPVNLATNFSEHLQCKQQESGRRGERERSKSSQVTVLPGVGEAAVEKEDRKRQGQDRSSDDFHFDKFVKKSKRN